jgi:carbamoyl-phosphate synthase small subunit
VSENLIALDEIRKKGWLVLADGSVFEGEAIGVFRDGADKVATGEVVFNTAMSGYQEIITDPSYAGQIIAFTYPHIGNYGVCSRDEQARHPFCRGIIVRDLATHPSNWGAQGDLEAFLTSNNIGGLTGIDTRRLTRHVREEGAMPCAIGTISKAELLVAAKEEQGTLGRDFVSEVTTPSPYTIHGGPLRVVAYDFGIKQKMLERLSWLATVDVVPASTPAKEALDRKPDGVLLSNGPGDPAALLPIIETVRELLGQVPIFARLWAPWGKPADTKDRHEPSRGDERESRLCSHGRHDRIRGCDARELERRGDRGTVLQRRARIQRSVSPGSWAGAARCELSLR